MSKTIKTLICLLLLVTGSLSAVAQQNKRLTVQIQNGSILDCIRSIEGQSDYSFLFSSSIGIDKKVSVNCVNQTLDQVLHAVFNPIGIAYDIQGSQITLRNASQAVNGRTIRGTISDQNGVAVVGAGVVISGTTNGTVTSDDGSFSLNVPSGPVTLDITSMGYSSRKIDVQPSQAVVDISLEEDLMSLDELVVVGYSTTSKRDLIASVSSVKAEQIANLPTVNISQGLAGRSPGLIVTQSGGGVNVTPSISIRGGGEPLYVIDGVVRSSMDFHALLPEDIEQLNILKDASATALYGSRATNGIIQVVTRQSAVGKLSVEYDFNQAFSQPSYWPEPLQRWEQYEYASQAYTNDGRESAYSQQTIDLAKQGLDENGHKMDRVRDVVMRNWAPMTRHTARLFAGNKVSQTFASFSHTDQGSLIKSGVYGFDRTNVRLSETLNIEKIGLQVNASLDGFIQTTNNIASMRLNSFEQAFLIMTFRPETVLFNEYGLPYSSGSYNMYAELSDDTGYNRVSSHIINARGEIVWNVPWVKGLKAKVLSNWRFNFYNSKVWTKPYAEYLWDSTSPLYVGEAQLSFATGRNRGYTNQALIDYTRDFGLHALSLTAAYEQYYQTIYDYSLARKDYDFLIDQISVGPASSQTNNGSESELGRAAFIGHAKYSFAKKWYLEGSFRYDGSDYFAPGKRWGAFYGGSVGWIVTSEPWMRSLVDKNILNMLKIRASYGQTGLDSGAGRFAYLSAYTLSSKSYVVDGAFASGFTEGALPSPDLTWYSTTQTDLGLDFSSAKNRLYGSFDYFYYKTHGYLIAPKGESYINNIIGASMPKVKSDSEHRREGIEFQLGWRDQKGDFSYDISGNFTYFDQLWAYDQGESEESVKNPYKRGQQNKGYYGTMYHCLGFYVDQADVFNSVAIQNAINTGYLFPGDLKYEDTNGDGQITSADERRYGKPSMPRGQFGININMGYKGFYFSSLWQGATNFNKMISEYYMMKSGSQGDLLTIFPFQTDTWTPTNTDAAYPRLMSSSGLNSGNNCISSDFWLLDGRYVRLKDLQFGYDFKYAVLKRLPWISKLRAGISGQNLLTFSNSKKYGLDPENGSTTGAAYPVERTIAFVLNIGF